MPHLAALGNLSAKYLENVSSTEFSVTITTAARDSSAAAKAIIWICFLDIYNVSCFDIKFFFNVVLVLQKSLPLVSFLLSMYQTLVLILWDLQLTIK